MPVTTTAILHLYLHQPTAIFKARLNLASATYPLTTLPFDGVTLGAYTDIPADATLILGSADGLDDYGRVRVQNVASATNIPVGRISQGTDDGTLSAIDNAYITVWNDFRVWAKLPYITAAGVAYKDSDVAIGTFTTLIPPVANCGPGTAGTINAGTSLLTVAFDGTASYAMADGATITGYAWDLQGGTVTVGTLTSSTLTATFTAGFRWISLTVTDSNGKSHTARCPVLAVNPAADVTVENFQIESHRITQEGQTIGFRILEDVPRATYPDGTLVMYWWNEPASASDRTHIKLIGWHQSDSVNMRAQPTGLLRDTVLHCVDVAGRLDALPGFPQALERVTPATTWEHMPGLTIDKCLHYLAFWHSTALSLADFIRSGIGNNYPAMRLDSTGSSLYEQINGRAKSMVPDHFLTCNTLGQLRVIADWMLKDVADRPAATATITEDYWSDIRLEYNRPPRVHVLRASAVVASTTWLALGGEDTLPLAFSIAPGDAFSQGTAESTHGEQLTISQATLNACTGHRYARLNARYGLFSISEPSGSISVWGYEPANMARVTLNISAAAAAQRGLDFTTANGMIKAIDLRYNHMKQGTWISPTLTWEKETVGLPAVTHIPDIPDEPDFETPDPPPATVPPDDGLIGGQQLVAAIGIDGYRYKTANFQTVSGSGGPTWTRDNLSIAATIYSWVVDPFSPGYAPGAASGAVNGWVVNDTAIYRVTDLHGTTVATSVHTFAVATSGAAFHWRSIQASFGAYFAAGANPWLLCVSYYGDTVGHTGTWATRSVDGGVTWSAEVQISTHYDQSTATRFNPIAVWTSPRTPGLARTAAYIETSLLPLADGYQSTDWGATWARMSADVVDNPALPLPRWVVYDDQAGAITSSGLGATKSISSVSSGGVTVDQFLWIAPPPNTKRMEITGTWFTEFSSPSGGTCDSSVSASDAATTTLTHDIVHTEPTPATADGVTGAGFSATLTFPSYLTLDWPVNTGNYAGAANSNASRFRAYSATTGAAGCTTIVTVTVTEIELDDGTIYVPPLLAAGMFQPGHGFGGSLHIPWFDNAAEEIGFYGNQDRLANREFRLTRSLGTALTDVSPVATGVTYGINRFGFAARAHDDDRQFVVASVIGNETSDDPTDDLHAVYISDDAGATWVEVVAPIADSLAPAGRPAFEAAFGGTSEQILFIWGPGAYISYSSNFGVAVDSRSGNLAALGLTTGLIGLAGGPTP